MIIPPNIRHRQATHPLCRNLHPTHIGIDRGRTDSVDRPDGDDTHILIFCISGLGFVRSRDRHTVIPTNHMLLVPAKVPHEYGAAPTHAWGCNWLHFSGELSHHYFSNATGTVQVSAIPDAIQSQVLGLYQELFHGITGSFETQNLIHASQILAHLLSALFVMPSAQDRPSTISGKATETMQQNLGTQITLEDLARDAGLSRAHFSVRFKSETGFSPIDYFNHLKIRHACRLLDDPSCTVGEVGCRIGIDSIHYFSRLFSKVMGMSPTAYRKHPKG